MYLLIMENFFKEKRLLKSLIACNSNFTLLWILPFIANFIYPLLNKEGLLIASGIVTTLSNAAFALNTIALISLR